MRDFEHVRLRWPVTGVTRRDWVTWVTRLCDSWITFWENSQCQLQQQERSLSGLTGDRVESKGASTGRPDLLVSVSPAACRAQPSAIATKNAHFTFLAIFWEVRKVAGPHWPATGLKVKGLALADQTCLWLFSCCLPRATEYHGNERRAFRTFRHFCTLSRTLPCNEPCLLSTAAYLLPPAATCCRRLLHLLPLLALRKPDPRFGDNPGEGSEQSVPWPVWSLFGARIRLVYTWQKSHWGSDHGCNWVGWRPRLLYVHASIFPWLLSTSNFSWTPHSSTERLCWPPQTCRIRPSPTTNLRCACDRFFDLPWPYLHVNLPHVCER